MTNKKSAAAGSEQPSENPGDTPELKPATLDEFMNENSESKNSKADTSKPTDEKPSIEETAADEPTEGAAKDESRPEDDDVADTTDKEFKTPEEAASEDERSSETSVVDDIEASEPEQPQFRPVVSNHMGKWARFRGWCKRHKVWVTILTLIIVIGALAAVPWTRYKLGGLFLKQTISIEVMDSQTHKAVTSATVKAKNVTAKTNNKGMADLKVPIGTTQVTIEKTYYKTDTVTTVAPILKPKDRVMVDLKATGRQVPVVVLNSITGKPIENAVVMASNAEAKTDKDGHVTLVLPTTKSAVTAMAHADGYNEVEATIQVTTQTIAANTIRLTPSGSTYFLSNQSGKLDVVKTDLDGSNRKVVAAGTGKEDNRNTVLLASRDWKYLALLSKRDGGDYAKLFLINTSTDQMTTMDEGSAGFGAIGWSGHNFIYSVTRKGQIYDNNHVAQKAYNAETGKITVLDQTQGEGDAMNNAYQNFNYAYITDKGLVYTVTWGSYYGSDKLAGKTNAIRLTSFDGKSKKDLKTFDAKAVGNLQAALYEPQGIYFAAYDSVALKYSFYEYEDGAVTTANTTIDAFNSGSYPTYLYSPSGSKTLWSEYRDGKRTIFVGNNAGKNGSQILKDSDYEVYGWYTEQYVLVSKNSSELYIMSVNGGTPHKISNYYKPDVSFYGYGYGYGGL
jgi:hypothetical protein